MGLNIKQLICKLLHIEFVRFGVVGVLATLIHYGILLLMR